MSDYNVYEVSSWTSETHPSVSIDSNTLTQVVLSSSNNFASGDDDIIKLGVTINGVVRYIYGVQIDQVPNQVGSTVTVSFDGNVYGDLLTGATFSSWERYPQVASDVSIGLKSYNISPSLSVATYGKDFKAYNSTLSYNIQAPQQKLVYNTRFKTLYNLNQKILLDSCDNNVYSVVPSELSAVAVNGRIKSALNFNVFIK